MQNNAAEEVGEPTPEMLEMQLRDLLGDIVTMKFLAHGAHWNVRGVNFSQFHEFFGEIYDSVDGEIDPLAENIRKLNFDAPFQLSDFIEDGTDMPVTAATDAVALSEMLYVANEDVRACIVAAIPTAGAVAEQGILNFLADMQDRHSKWQWQLRATIGDEFANANEIDVEEVSESPEDEAVETNSVSSKWATAANLIVRKLEPVMEAPVEGRGKNFETRINHANVELRAVEGSNGMTFEGYAAVFNSPSDPIGGQFTEYVQPGAFKRSLESRNDVKLLWNHDTGEVLGSTRSGTLKLVEDARGLKAIAELPNTQRGRDTAELIKRGDIASMSFGFSVPKGGDSWSDGGSIRHLNSVRLFEVSVVAFPAYQASSASVRSAGISADALAEGLMKLENGEDLDPAQAAVINDVVAKLTKMPEAQDSANILDLKKKQLDLMMKRI